MLHLQSTRNLLSLFHACKQTSCPLGSRTTGVDSSATSHDALSRAKLLATLHKCIVAVSGKVDYVSSFRAAWYKSRQFHLIADG